MAVLIMGFSLCACKPRPSIRFDSEPCLIPSKDYWFRTCRFMSVEIDKNNIIIPDNFKTDLASIPKPLWSFYSPLKTETIAPSILHDFMYNCPNDYSRYEADRIFYYALRDHDLDFIHAILYYAGVRMFGSSVYNPTGPCPFYV